MFSEPTQSSRPCLIPRLVGKLLRAERARGLSQRSLDELSRHLGALLTFLDQRCIDSLIELTPAVLLDFVQQRGSSPSEVKSIVWTIRKFGAYLALMQYLPESPAKAFTHPKLSPRAKLPQYLKPAEMRAMLETAVSLHSLRDVTVLSLALTAGLRPKEIAQLRRCDVDTDSQVVFLRVKGGWRKRTPISAAMAETLRDYLMEYPDSTEMLFLNDWRRPLDQRWVLRLVRCIARQAGIRRNVTPRMLRHSFATYLADRHGKILTKALLGHAASQSTDVYMHLIPSVYRRYMNRHPFQLAIDRSRV